MRRRLNLEKHSWSCVNRKISALETGMVVLRAPIVLTDLFTEKLIPKPFTNETSALILNSFVQVCLDLLFEIKGNFCGYV